MAVFSCKRSSHSSKTTKLNRSIYWRDLLKGILIQNRLKRDIRQPSSSMTTLQALNNMIDSSDHFISRRYMFRIREMMDKR